jgi:hypothetical protein
MNLHMLDLVISRRRLKWEWQVRDLAGNIIARGREASRAAARYQAERALFARLLASGLHGGSSGRDLRLDR